MSLINQRIIKLDVSEIVGELKRLNHNLEQLFQIDKPQAQPYLDFDPDEFSSVSYPDEESDLIQQHMDRHVAGIKIT
jgi:hypothetical protein